MFHLCWHNVWFEADGMVGDKISCHAVATSPRHSFPDLYTATVPVLVQCPTLAPSKPQAMTFRCGGSTNEELIHTNNIIE